MDPEEVWRPTREAGREEVVVFPVREVLREALWEVLPVENGGTRDLVMTGPLNLAPRAGFFWPIGFMVVGSRTISASAIISRSLSLRRAFISRSALVMPLSSMPSR